MQRGILSSKRRRAAMDAVMDPPERHEKRDGLPDFESSRKESWGNFKRRHGMAGVTVRMPDRPVGYVALDGRVWDGQQWTRPHRKETHDAH